MSIRSGPLRALIVLGLAVAMLLSLGAASIQAKDTDAQTVVGVENLGVVTFETGTIFEDTEVGGLSGITYDAARGGYYALSDDRSQTDPARYYTVDIDFADGSLDDGDVTFLESRSSPRVELCLSRDRWIRRESSSPDRAICTSRPRATLMPIP